MKLRNILRILFILLILTGIVSGLLYVTIYFNQRDIKKLSMPSNKDGLNFTIKNKELLDQSILLETGGIKNVDMQILSLKKMENMSFRKEEPKKIILNLQNKVLSTRLSAEKLLLLLTQVFGLMRVWIALSLKRKSSLAKLAFFMEMIKIISVQELTQT